MTDLILTARFCLGWDRTKSITNVVLFPLTCFWEDRSMNCCFRRKPRARLWTVSRMNLCKMPMKILPVKTWGVWVSCEQRKRHHTESFKYQARKMTKNQMKHATEQCQGGLKDEILKGKGLAKKTEKSDFRRIGSPNRAPGKYLIT